MDELNKEAREAYEKTKKLLEDNDHIEELEMTLREASETIKKLQKARRVSEETLNKRFDI